LNKEQLSAELTALRIKTLSKSVQKGSLDGRKIKATDKAFKATNAMIVEQIFGSKTELSY